MVSVVALEFTKFQFIVGLALTGLFTGFGAALGTYFANFIVNKFKKLKRK